MWPGVSQAAFDTGGSPPHFVPRRNVSSVTDAAGVATFSLRLARADPSRRIRLLFTAFPVAEVDDLADAERRQHRTGSSWAGGMQDRGNIALAIAHSRFFHIRHHFAR